MKIASFNSIAQSSREDDKNTSVAQRIMRGLRKMVKEAQKTPNPMVNVDMRDLAARLNDDQFDKVCTYLSRLNDRKVVNIGLSFEEGICTVIGEEFTFHRESVKQLAA